MCLGDVGEAVVVYTGKAVRKQSSSMNHTYISAFFGVRLSGHLFAASEEYICALGTRAER